MLISMLAKKEEKHNMLNMCFKDPPCSILKIIGPAISIKVNIIMNIIRCML